MRMATPPFLGATGGPPWTTRALPCASNCRGSVGLAAPHFGRVICRARGQQKAVAGKTHREDLPKTRGATLGLGGESSQSMRCIVGCMMYIHMCVYICRYMCVVCVYVCMYVCIHKTYGALGYLRMKDWDLAVQVLNQH